MYGDYLAVDLARLALKGLLTKTALDAKSVDQLIVGTVIQEPRTSNIAREAGMGAGIPISVPATTVTQACISSNQVSLFLMLQLFVTSWSRNWCNYLTFCCVFLWFVYYRRSQLEQRRFSLGRLILL